MDKRDRIIQFIREMMVANPPGVGGGFSSNSLEPEKTAGYSHVLDMFKRTKTGKVDKRAVKKKYRKWL